MNRLKPNKYPSKCSICGVTFAAYTGTLFFERSSEAPKGRGRPEGKFIAFCGAHQSEANQRLNGVKDDPQDNSHEAIQEPIRHEDEGHIMPPSIPLETMSTKSQDDTALSLAEMLVKLTSNPGVNEAEVRRIALECANQVLGNRVATVVEIRKDNEAVSHDIGAHHYLLPDIITILSQGLHIYLVGPAGAGKTTLANQASKALEKSFWFTGALDSKYGLIGFRDAHGNYHRTPFREAFEHGGVFLFDEVDASSANAMLSFNAALANGHMDFPDGIVERHPDFVAIASANTFGNGQDRLYVGRNQLDAATLDRFVTVEMNYDEKLERSLVGDDRKAIAWVEFVQRTRKAVSDLKLRYVVSPRASIQGSKLLLAGMDASKVATMTLYRSMKPEDVSKVQGYTGPLPR